MNDKTQPEVGTWISIRRLTPYACPVRDGFLGERNPKNQRNLGYEDLSTLSDVLPQAECDSAQVSAEKMGLCWLQVELQLSATRRALVLGGGGFAASAWEVGFISGVAATGVDLRDYDMFLGTSSGARVALHLASGSDLDELFHQHLSPIPISPASASVDWQKVRAEWARAKEIGGGPTAILRRVGALALAVAGSGGGDRRKVVAAQLPIQTWPEKALVIVAVNAETGERRAFDRNMGVELVDAVMATTAFWGWPPAFFEDYHYIDGGFYSSDNADLASGFDQVLILGLRPPVPSLCIASLDEAVESLRASGAQVEVVHPDEDCLQAFSSVGGPMNPAVRAPAAKAGRAQGLRLAERGLLSL